MLSKQLFKRALILLIFSVAFTSAQSSFRILQDYKGGFKARFDMGKNVDENFGFIAPSDVGFLFTLIKCNGISTTFDLVVENGGRKGIGVSIYNKEALFIASLKSLTELCDWNCHVVGGPDTPGAELTLQTFWTTPKDDQETN